jgi:hypothetical protein
MAVLDTAIHAFLTYFVMPAQAGIHDFFLSIPIKNYTNSHNSQKSINI